MPVEVQENKMGWVVSAIRMADNLIGLVGSGEAVGSVQLMICPPRCSPIPQQIKSQHRKHPNPQNQHPMHTPLRGRFLVNDKAFVTPLNNLAPVSGGIPPRAGWHSGSFFWIVQIVSQV